MAVPVEPQLDAVMDETLSLDPSRQPSGAKDVNDALLENSRPHARYDVLRCPSLENDGLDPLLVQQVREQKTRRACPDDRDLRAGHGSLPPHAGSHS